MSILKFSAQSCPLPQGERSKVFMYLSNYIWKEVKGGPGRGALGLFVHACQGSHFGGIFSFDKNYDTHCTSILDGKLILFFELILPRKTATYNR